MRPHETAHFPQPLFLGALQHTANSMYRIGPCLAIATLWIASANVALAQLSDSVRSRLASEIETAAKNLDPKLFPDLDESKAEVLRNIRSARSFFDSKTSAKNRDAWLTYLDLDELEQKLQSEKEISPTSIARDAIDLRFRLVGTAPGLELSVLLKLRDSIEQLVEAVRFRDPERATVSLSKQLTGLAERVRELDDSPTADDSATIAALLSVLDSSGQASNVVESMRATFSRPNVAILVGEPVVQSAVFRSVNQTRPVQECILGTRIVGSATMNGAVTANLLPSIGAARLNVSLAGHVVSNNVGYNGPVRLRTVGYGNVNVSRAMSVNESGVALEPAYAHAALRTEITAIEHRLRIVRKIAGKRAAKQKPQADKIAVEKMRKQVGSQFDDETREAAAIPKPNVLAKIRPVLKRLSLDEPARLWGSTDSNIFIDSTFRRQDQLSTVVSRPPVTDSFDAAIQVHESVIDNAFAPILAGRTLKEDQLNELLEKSGQPALKPISKDDEKEEEPFEIDFARLQPIVFEARDQKIRIGIRGSRFAQGKRVLKESMEITASYEPARTSDGAIVLIRSGDVDVNFGRKRLSVSQAGIKRTIQKKFSEVFPETLLHQPLEMPTDTTIDALRGRQFRPRLVDARDGWLTIGIR
ncbi:MAG: hypothetical protein AB8B91_08040 [Rubripirellula sp.]